MSWQKVSPKRYERAFDSLEQFYRAIADAGKPLNKEHYLISSVIKLESLPSAADVQQAWKALRKQYPQIAAVADDSGTRFVYTVPSPAELETWAQETFIVESTGNSADKLYTTLEPSPLFKLYYLRETRELFFRMPHWRIDGIGLMDLQTALLRILADGPPVDVQLDGSEAVHLAPALDEVASVPHDVTPSISEAAESEIGVFLDGLPGSISITTLPNALPTEPRRIQLDLPADITQRVISACKARGITVTTAAHAALVVATLPHAQHNFDVATRGQSGGKYTGFNAIDLRKYLPAPYNGADAAVSIYHTGVPFSVDLSECRDFDSIAAYFRTEYRRKLNQNEPRNMFNFLAEYVRKVLGLLGSTPPDPLRAPAHPELSTLGIINDHLQAQYKGNAMSIVVQDWWVAIEVINRLLLTNVWTWNSKLSLSINWNNAFYEDSFVSQFLGEWKTALLKELNVT